MLVLVAACAPRGQAREVRHPVDLRHLCPDARFSDVCTPSVRPAPAPTVIDTNLAVPPAQNPIAVG
jgi:hypothetical protein